MALFGNVLNDALFAFGLGLLAGLAAELVDNKGNIEWPHRGEKYYGDAGFLYKVFVGGIAALAFFYVLDTDDPFKFIGASIAAGVSGSAFLIAIKEKLIGTVIKEEAEKQAKNAKEASELVEKLVKMLDQLKTRDKLKFRGPTDIENDIETLKNVAKVKASEIKGSAERASERLQKLK